MPVTLTPLVGTNPLGVLAALGVLDVLDRRGQDATLHWTEEIRPHAVIGGMDDVDDVVAHVVDDRERWRTSPVLFPYGAAGAPADVKVRPEDLRAWSAAVLHDGDRADQSLFCALVAEGAVAGTGDSKPTHLHFIAGQQRFLAMVRKVLDALDGEHLHEALVGPWRYSSTLPTFAWDARGERTYALRATDPGKEQRPGVPGADWLAFLGLAYFPVVSHDGTLVTTACGRPWKRGWMRWPLWSSPLPSRVVRSLVADAALADEPQALRRARGVTAVMRAPIRRTDQGGYGSFGTPTSLVAAGTRSSARLEDGGSQFASDVAARRS